MDKKMIKVEKYWKWVGLIAGILTAIYSCFSFGYKVLEEFENQNILLEKTAYIAEKSFIWNKEIPKVERAEVCDIYLADGNDSYTKKLCENEILQDEALYKESGEN